MEIFQDSYFYFPFNLYPDIKYEREIIEVYIVQHMYSFKAECDILHILSLMEGIIGQRKRYCARRISSRLNKLVLTCFINNKLSFRYY